MAIDYTNITVPLDPVADTRIVGGDHAEYWPLPNRNYSREDYGFNGRRYFDTAWSGGNPPAGGTVFYFHGSGAQAPFETNDPLIVELINEGYEVIQVMSWGVWTNPPSPYRYNYGNVNAPTFMQTFIRNAIWVEATYLWAVDQLPGGRQFMFLGHSMGASACLYWASNFFGRSATGQFDPRYRGIFANGATIGGLGDYSWNDVIRNISTMTSMLPLLRGLVVLSYANLDTYAPPDYARRLQTVLSPSRTVYMLSPGDYGHSWFSQDTTAAELVSMWVGQILGETLITLRDGETPAVPGPVSTIEEAGERDWVLETGYWNNEGFWFTDRDWSNA